MPRRVRKALLKVTAFRLALWAGLIFTGLHFLNGVFLGRGFELPVVAKIEHAAQDWALTSLRGPRRPSGDVVIVAIDERSVEAEGLWPWSRARMARLVDRLAEGGVRAVAFDVIWSEEDELGRRMARVASLVRSAREGARDPEAARRLDEVWAAAAGPTPEAGVDVDPTERLADAIERARNVTVGFTFLSGGDAPAAASPARVEQLRFFRTEPPHVLRGGALAPAGDGVVLLGRFAGVVPPVGAVVAVADSGGFVTVVPDGDGVIRRYRTVASAGGTPFPALGVALLARVEGRDGAPAPVVPVGAPGAPESLQQVRVGGLALDVDDLGRVGLDYYGPYRTFPTWSATDVLHGRISADQLRGKIAVVGTTAAGTWDQRVTPFDDVAPGVITHATFVENALRGELLERSGAVLAAEVALMLALSVGLAFAFARVSSLAAAPALALALAAWGGGAVLALSRAKVVVALGMPSAQMLAMFVAATTYRFFSEEREKRRARETFGRFLAPAIVDEVLAKEGSIRLGGEKRVLTVLFCDVRGFTTISEKLDPHVLLELLNEYLTPMTDIIVSGHQGTLDKYIGDAIMAFWGAPREQPDHAARACRAALAMIDRLAELRARWRAQGLPDVDVGVGVNTGPMSVGFVGSQDRFYNYTVLGDAVNLASRLEGANKEYGTRVILGPATYEMARDAVVARALDLVRVKGKREPVQIHELLALRPAPPGLAAFVERFAWGLSAYRAQRWDEAIARFREADQLRGGDPPSRTYVERCEAMRREPPGPEWDGVFEMKTK
ncbi:MAG TPA: adenylate/guanylate cyclase domain-containing protein [Anaeromyxobacter sp.]